MKKKILLLVWLLVLASGGGVKADELAELKRQLAEQAKLLQQMQQRLEQLEASQKVQEQNVDEKISKAVEEKQIGALPESLKWVENVKLSGDLRYRHETRDTQGSSWQKGRNRHRIRARLGLDAKVNSEVDLGFRIASGSADPASTNQTLEDSFSSKELWLDLAYFDWHPNGIPAFNLIGGKMKNPFYKVGGNQLIWDGDVNPEGIAAKYVIALGDYDKLHINGGGFWVNENSAGANTSLWGAQAYLKHTFKNSPYLLGGISYFDYADIKGRGNLKGTWSTSTSFFGNTSSGNRFASDYDIFEAFGEFGFEVKEMPVAVFGDYAKNTASASSQDTGWLIGCKVNKAKKPGTWEASYNYRDLQADAVLGAFTDSDFIGGGTNGRGHTFGFKYQIANNWQTALTYFHNEWGDNNADYRKLQADLIFKF